MSTLIKKVYILALYMLYPRNNLAGLGLLIPVSGLKGYCRFGVGAFEYFVAAGIESAKEYP